MTGTGPVYGPTGRARHEAFVAGYDGRKPEPPYPTRGDAPKFVIKKLDDEHEEYYIGDRQVASASHDSDGWAGMESVRTLFENVAAALGATVETFEVEGEE